MIVDTDRPQRVTRESVLAKCGWSPFEGHEFGATIDTTIVNGRIAWRNGSLTGEIAGQRLDCTRAR